MKKNFSIILVCFVLFCFGQLQDLASLKQGKPVGFFLLIEEKKKERGFYENPEDRIFGYLSLYNLGSVDKENDKYEYIVFDKNLNKLVSGEFNGVAKDKLSSIMILGLMNKNIIDISLFGMNNFTNKFLNINTNKIEDTCDCVYADPDKKEQYYYDNKKDIIITITKNDSTTTKIKSFEYRLKQNEGDENYYVNTYKTINKKDSLPKIILFDANKSKIAEYISSKEIKKLTSIYLNYLSTSKDYIYLEEKYSDFDKNIETTDLLKVDIKSGKIVQKEIIEDLLQSSSFYYTPNGLFYSTGNSSNLVYDKYNSKSAWDNLNPYNIKKGLFRIQIDKNEQKLTLDKYLWENSGEKINKEGKDKNGFSYKTLGSYVLKDGKIVFILGKFKKLISYNKEISGNMYIYVFDKNFNLIKKHEIEKNKQKETVYDSDFLYTQYLPSKDGVALFYKNKENKENILGILTYINGELKEEKIPISSKNEYEILPYPAKEGYILLREYNEKDKYNQIRLEKLNY